VRWKGCSPQHAVRKSELRVLRALRGKKIITKANQSFELRNTAGMKAAAKLLVVDDTPKNVKLLADILTARGYNVVTAASGA
jgi:PleD family two-component response regulator